MNHCIDRLSGKCPPPSRSFIISLLFCVCICSLAPPPAEAWGNKKKDLDSVVERLVDELVDQGDLEDKPVIVSPHDLFDSATGLSLPLTNQLRGKITSEMAKRGVRVLLPGSDEDSNMIFQGTWQKQGEDLALDFKVMRISEHGPEVAAAVSEKTPFAGIDPEALKKNRESYSRLLIRKLESKSPDRRTRRIYFAGFLVDGKSGDDSGMAAYLSDMIRTAMAESPVFIALDEKKELRGLSSETLRVRGAKRGISAKQKQDDNSAGLTADLINADAQLRCRVWRQGRSIAVNVDVNDMDGGQITAASVDIPHEIFPERMVNPPPPPQFEKKEPGTVSGGDSISKGGLTVQITTDHGGAEPLYRQGEHIRFIVRISQDAWIYLFDINPKGEVVLLYPVDKNGMLARDQECGSRLSAGAPLVLPEDGCSYDLTADAPYGRDIVWVAASQFPLDLSGISESVWANVDAFEKSLRNQAFSANGGYSEARVAIVTAP